MRLDIRYPISFEALPFRTARRKNVVCSFLHSQDVPEIDTSQTTPISIGHGQTYLTFEDRLFRKVGSLGDEDTRRCLGSAFDVASRAQPYQVGGKHAEHDRHYQHYYRQPHLGHALEENVYRRIFLATGEKAKERLLWPPIGTRSSGNVWTRAELAYEDLEHRLADVDEDQFASQRQGHEAEAARLLLVNGDLWVETPPPALCVNTLHDSHDVYATINLVFLPNWLDADLNRQYFPLHQHEQAVEFSRSAIGQRGLRPVLNDETAGFALNGEGPLDFDAASYAVTRTALLMGADAACTIGENDDLRDIVGRERAEAAFKAMDMAMACGTFPQDWPTADDIIRDVTEAWTILGRKPGWTEFSSNRQRWADSICERAVAMADEMLISLVTRQEFGP